MIMHFHTTAWPRVSLATLWCRSFRSILVVSLSQINSDSFAHQPYMCWSESVLFLVSTGLKLRNISAWGAILRHRINFVRVKGPERCFDIMNHNPSLSHQPSIATNGYKTAGTKYSWNLQNNPSTYSKLPFLFEISLRSLSVPSIDSSTRLNPVYDATLWMWPSCRFRVLWRVPPLTLSRK